MGKLEIWKVREIERGYLYCVAYFLEHITLKFIIFFVKIQNIVIQMNKSFTVMTVGLIYVKN